MPEATGTDICRTLKNEYGTQDIPIVLFSSLPDEELSKLAEQVGADGFLSKANGLEAMGEKIDELVSEHPLVSHAEADLGARGGGAPLRGMHRRGPGAAAEGARRRPRGGDRHRRPARLP